MKVKIIITNFVASLEREINEYLRTHIKIQVIDIKYTLNDYHASAMIIYKENYSHANN